MIFGSVPIDEAQEAILAHSVGHPGGRVSKGTILSAQDIALLKQAGLSEVVVARLQPGDLTEDVAAGQLAACLKSSDVRLSAASTGRVNIYALRNGLFRADRDLIDRFNRVDPAITLACLADRAPVAAGDMVATVKIIPLAVAGDKVEAAKSVAAKGKAVSIAPYRPFAVTLIQTELPVLKTSVLDKTKDLLSRRLAPSGSVIIREERVPHRADAVAAAVRRALTRPENGAPHMVILFGASAVCDGEDVLPEAMRLAGAKVEQVGLPVDPGNLLVLGYQGDVALIGAPGCARSPKENGFDWVLNRILSGERPRAQDLTGLGVGGLLMEIPGRPQPRELAATKGRALVIGTLLLAAGRASRMGDAGHKLLAEFDGVPLVRRVAERALAAAASHDADGQPDNRGEEQVPEPLVVVTGHRGTDVSQALSGLDLTLVDNPDYASGMASSIKAGLASSALSDVSGVMVLLADMPAVSAHDLQTLQDAFRKAEGRAIVRAVAGGKRGNPVILPRATFGELMLLQGDVGARHVIETCGLPIIDVEIGEAAHIDVDTPDAVVAAGGLLRG
ncbi:NTP transferase domain-containing protein [Rhizobium sp. SGZ-381]|uniref:NTP transferase domain-containing protein n=1 Tax=Rhizobium sp. SGZ-381 TaxID=3342800 RepID=UPI0036704004